MKRLDPISTVLVTAWLACGCGPSEPARQPVEGTVTIDGKPLPQGYIIFYPAETGSDADTGTIADGKFVLQTSPGTKRIEITATRPIPGTADPLGQPNQEQYLPKKYNSQSVLTATVSAEDENRFEFPLESASR